MDWRWHRRYLLGAVLALALATFVWQVDRFAAEVQGQRWILDDFAAYWAAARLTLSGDDPYSPGSVGAVQRPLGLREDQFPLVMWYPPWALPLVLPFGLMSYAGGRVAWLLVSLLALLIGAQLLWRTYGGETRRYGWSWVIALTFVPAFASLVWGQVGPLMLLGIALFLRFILVGRWALAGAATLLLAPKPHVLYLFWIALALWVIWERRYTVIAATAAALMLATGISLVLRPTIVGDYLRTMINQGPTFWITPTPGSYLRLLAGHENVWVQFLPVGIGLVWLILHGWKRRNSWRWDHQLPTVILVSVVTTPFAWVHDQVVFLPALISCFLQWRRMGGRLAAKALALLGYVVVNTLPFTAATPTMKSLTPGVIADRLPPGQANQFWLVWMAPAFLVGYLLCRRAFEHPTGRSS
ncbi:MAG TPA: glycosyltransferase family 87 protein [Blastocatellia bacterium]|nr:glycosyltransferase family 87 protein [Blastocatellia bacterium]